MPNAVLDAPDTLLVLPFALLVGSTLESPMMTYRVVSCQRGESHTWKIGLVSSMMHVTDIEGNRK